SYVTSAMRADRFGSYSIEAIVPVTPCLLRLKSTRRYWRLWPPPRRRIAMWPWLSRPPDFLIGSSSDFSGVVVVMSEKSDTVRKRVPFVTGLDCLIPMVYALQDSLLSLRRSRSCPLRGASRPLSSSWDGGRRSCPCASPCRARSTSTRQ